MKFFFVRKIVEFGLFQASELGLNDRIAILTRISHAEEAEFRNITRFNVFYMRNTSQYRNSTDEFEFRGLK